MANPSVAHEADFKVGLVDTGEVQAVESSSHYGRLAGASGRFGHLRALQIGDSRNRASNHGNSQSPLFTRESVGWLESGRRESNPRSQLGNRAESNDSRVNPPQRSLITRLSRNLNSRGRLSGAPNAELNRGLASHKRWTD